MNSSSTPSLLPFGPKPTADAPAAGKVSFTGSRGDAALLAGFGPTPEGLLFEGLVPLQPVSADAKAVAAAILAPATTAGEGGAEGASLTQGELASFLGASAVTSRRVREMETPAGPLTPGQPTQGPVPSALPGPANGEAVVLAEAETEGMAETPELPLQPSTAGDRKARAATDGAAAVAAGLPLPAAPAITPSAAPADDQTEMAPEQRVNATAPTRQPAGRVIVAPTAPPAPATPAMPSAPAGEPSFATGEAPVARPVTPTTTPARNPAVTGVAADGQQPSGTTAPTGGDANSTRNPGVARVATDVSSWLERAERPANASSPVASPAPTTAPAEPAKAAVVPSSIPAPQAPVAAPDARPTIPVANPAPAAASGSPAPAQAPATPAPAPASSAMAQAAATVVPSPKAKTAGVSSTPVAAPSGHVATAVAGGSASTVSAQAVPAAAASDHEADVAGRSPRTADVAGLVDDTPAVALPQQVSGWKKILLNAYKQHVKGDVETVGIKDAKADGIMPTLLTTPFTPVESTASTAPVAPTPSSIPAEWAEKLAQLTARADRLAPARLEVSLPMEGGEDLRVRVSCRGGHISCEFQNASSELQRLFLREWPGLSQLFGRENAQLRVEQPSFVNLTDPQDRPGGDQSNRRQRDEHAAREEDEAIAAFFATQRKPAGRAA